MSEDAAIDAMVERMAREEQDDVDRRHGQQILDMAASGNQERDKELFEMFNEAWRSEAEAEQADK